MLCFSAAKSFHGTGQPFIAFIIPLLIMGFIFIVMLTIVGVISLFLDDFVVPIMYKKGITTTEAWHHFLTLFQQNIGHFLLYIFAKFVIGIIVFIVVMTAGVITCCIGFLLLMLPYIGSVVKLPVSYTLRAFSLEFLAQFGDEFTIFSPKPLESLDQQI